MYTTCDDNPLQDEMARNLTLARELTATLRATKAERDALKAANEQLNRVNAGLLARIAELETPWMARIFG